MTKNTFFTFSSTLVIATLLQASPGYAQAGAPVTDAMAAEAGIDEIVVTAEKRPSTAQKTAIAMSVLTAESLAKNGVANLADLTQVAPSVSFSQAGPATIITVRGVSSRDTSEIGDPAVSIAIDGFNLQRALGLNQAMFDLERVEVLRGPQGTLVGRNATGGAINIVTGKPVLNELKGYVGFDAGNYARFNAKGMINVPVNDWLAVRAAFQTTDHHGYRNNAPSDDGDDEHGRAARVHVLMKPTDRLSLLATGEYTQSRNVGTATQAIPLTFYTAANVPAGFNVGDPVLGVPARGNARDYPLAPGSFLRMQSWNYRLQADYDLGFAALTYQGGYRRFKISRRTTLGGAYGTDRQNFAFGQHENLPSWNHELRLSSKLGGPLRWQFGGFYFQEKNNLNTQFQDYPGQSSLAGTPVLIQDYVYPDIVSKAKALFGQASYEFIPGLTAEFGMRYSHDEKHRIGYNTVTNLNTYLSTRCWQTSTCRFVTTPQNSTATSSKSTFHGALNYQATPDNLLYAKYDTGYKAGGFTDLAPYDPESNEAFEIGAKNRFFNNKLQINVDAFLYNYTNQQVSQTIINPNTGAIATQVSNAGKSRYKGAEADIVFQPDPDTRINAYVGYLHARFVDFVGGVSGLLARAALAQGAALQADGVTPATTFATTVNWQLAGKTAPQAPEWTINLGVEHDFHVFGGTLTPRAQMHYESKSYFTVYNFDSDKQKSYTRSDIVVSYTPENKAWDLQFYVRNVENSIILANAQVPNSGTYLSYREQYMPPRTFGASFVYKF